MLLDLHGLMIHLLMLILGFYWSHIQFVNCLFVESGLWCAWSICPAEAMHISCSLDGVHSTQLSTLAMLLLLVCCSSMQTESAMLCILH